MPFILVAVSVIVRVCVDIARNLAAKRVGVDAALRDSLNVRILAVNLDKVNVAVLTDSLNALIEPFILAKESVIVSV